MWSYTEAVAWLYARQRLGIKLGLGKVQQLLAALGDPHNQLRTIHIAGTNGKGSVTRMLAEILQRSGYRTGATTSPHLVRFTERITIDGVEIPQTEVAQLLAHIRPHVEHLDEAGTPPTFFEIVTAMALLHFAREKVDWAVVETGLGGRLDATNVVQPQLTVITNVSLDHEALLGDSVGEIALEKAGIMKAGVPLVTAATGPALDVLKLSSHPLRVPMSIIGVDYIVVPDPDHLVLLRPTGESRYQVGLQGTHQRVNAAIAVASVEALRTQGANIPERAVHAGLQHVRHRGRLEPFLIQGPHGDVEVLVDGAHNPAAAQAVRETLFDLGWRGFHLITGFCADKAWEKILDEWILPAAHVWAVPVRNPRTLEPQHIVEACREAGVRAAGASSPAEALTLAVAAGARRILIAGSLYLAGEAIAHLEGEGLEEIHGTQ